MKRPIKAYSCRPREEEYHIVVFTTNAPRARLLGFQADPAHDLGLFGFSGLTIEDYVVSRLPQADGLSVKECAWVHQDDAPADVRERATALWTNEEG